MCRRRNAPIADLRSVRKKSEPRYGPPFPSKYMIDPEILLKDSLRRNFTERYPPLAAGGKLSAVMILLRHRKDAWEVFFTRRSEALADHRGQIAFPGGRAEPGDSGPLQTALRETCEEVGIPPGAVHPLWILKPVDTSTGYRVWPVVGVIRTPADPRPSSPEVAEAFWIPLDWLAAEGRWERKIVHADENNNSVRENSSQAIARSEATKQSPVFDRRRRLLRSLRSLAMTSSLIPHPVGEREAIFFEPYQGHVIWGATATIMVQLLDRLRTGGSK